MIVPVVAVLSVAVAVVDVVDVVTVRNGNVTAVGTVLVVVPLVDVVLGGLTLVVVAIVLAVQVTIVYVINVILVRNGNVAAVRSVLVIVVGVGGAAHYELLLFEGNHGANSSSPGGLAGRFDTFHDAPHLPCCQYVFIRVFKKFSITCLNWGIPDETFTQRRAKPRHQTPKDTRSCVGRVATYNVWRERETMENNTTDPLDVLIVGGGFAGTAAGITLARALRHVSIVDNGTPRNRFSAHAHGILGRDGANPMDLLDQGRSEFTSFGGTVIPGEVTALERVGSTWEATIAHGSRLHAKQILVATGITDELPDVPGLAELWGSRVFHCPYCHGYEVRDRKLAVIGGKNPGFTVHMVHLMRKWTDSLTFFTNGLSLSEVDRALFEKRGVALLDAPVSGIQPDPESESGVLVSTSDDPSSTTPGAIHAFEACFTGPEFHPNDQLLLAAGCETENGWVLRQALGQTSVAGLWTAGNVTSSPDQVSQAMGAGVATAIAIDQSLLHEELAQLQEQVDE